MDNPTPSSYWLDTVTSLETPATLPDRAQVVIVGGGVFGVSAALFLARAGAEVLLLDQRRLAGGATGRNAGIVSPATTENYLDAAARLGRAGARLVWQFTEDSAVLLKEILIDEQIDAWQRVEGTHALAMTEAQVARQQQAVDWLNADGFAMEWLDRTGLQAHMGLDLPTAFLGARYNPRTTVLHSARLVLGLAQAAQRYGAQIRQGVRVQAVEAGSVDIDQGQIRADHIVLATNAYTGGLVPALAEIIKPTRGQMRATAPLGRRVFAGAWSANDGGEYWQQTQDGALVLGGMRRRAHDADEGYTVDEVNSTVQAALDEFVALHFPDVADAPVTHRWAGIMGFTPDHTPLIGPLGPRLYITAGCSGHGMPFATEAGRQIANWIFNGHPDRDMRVFDPGRFG